MNAVERTELGQLLVRAADGDRGALAPLFRLAWPAVQGVCRRLVIDADVDEAAQEAMVRVFARAASYDPGRDALTWVLTLAAWECRTLRRRRDRRREAPADAMADPATTAPSPDELAERRELLAVATDLLGTLSPIDARTLVAAWTDDDEARAALAPATFRKRLARALARFRSSWRSRHDLP